MRAQPTSRTGAGQANTKSRFISSVSHELRTPLKAIIGLTEMMVMTARHWIALSVSDTGIGMTPGQQAKLFESSAKPTHSVSAARGSAFLPAQARPHDGRRCDGGERARQGLGLYSAPANRRGDLGVAAVSVPAAINAASVSGLIVVTVGVRSGTGRGCCNPAVVPLAMVARTESAPSSLTRPHASAALNKPLCTSDSDNAPPLTSWCREKDAR
jgi:hypothetical protein